MNKKQPKKIKGKPKQHNKKKPQIKQKQKQNQNVRVNVRVGGESNNKTPSPSSSGVSYISVPQYIEIPKYINHSTTQDNNILTSLVKEIKDNMKHNTPAQHNTPAYHNTPAHNIIPPPNISPPNTTNHLNMSIPKIRKTRGANKPKILAVPVPISYNYAPVEPAYDYSNFKAEDPHEIGQLIDNPMRTMTNNKLQEKIKQNPFIQHDLIKQNTPIKNHKEDEDNQPAIKLGAKPKPPKKTAEEIKATRLHSLEKAREAMKLKREQNK